MEFFFKYDWFVIIAVAMLVFLITFVSADRVMAWLHQRSLGQREEVMRYLNLMFVETDQRKVTLAMVSSSFGLGAILFMICWPHLIVGTIMGTAVTIGMWSLPKIFIRSMWENAARFSSIRWSTA